MGGGSSVMTGAGVRGSGGAGGSSMAAATAGRDAGLDGDRTLCRVGEGAGDFHHAPQRWSGCLASARSKTPCRGRVFQAGGRKLVSGGGAS